MGLCRQIVDLVRLYQTDNAHQRGGIRQISIVKCNRVLCQQMIDPERIGYRSPTGNPMNLISFFQQKFRQIGAVLPCNTGNQCFFCHTFLSSTFLNMQKFLPYIVIISCHFNKRNAVF